MKKLHCNLKSILRDRRVKQIEVCRETDISPNTISKLCCNHLHGGIHTQTIEKLCDYLEIELCDLLELR